MKHIIVGTAGHIDHGKTTLIRAITGRDTDRLEEEKRRGISIDLGFTYFDLPSGKRAGIIDVPGHEKFIKNMLAGAMGMDVVILVIGADEGIMPQTKEHMAILDLLGTKKGFVVLTKIDLVDDEWRKLVVEDIRNETKGTFLENCDIIPASSMTGEGIDKVISAIDKAADEVEERDFTGTPRLPVDRVFVLPGIGTIVTGTLLSGTFKVGDEVQIFPGNKVCRIRSLQVHDEDVSIAYAGQRVAANLAGVKKNEIQRGDVLGYKGSMKKTMMIDGKIRLLKDISRSIENRTRLRLYIESKEVLCRIILLDKESLYPGESAYVQLRLEEEIVAKKGDKFILRFYSPMFTIGGGEIIEVNPEKKKRFDEKIIKELELKEKGDTSHVIEKIIFEKSRLYPTIKDISMYSVIPEEKVEEEVKKLSKADKIILFPLTKDTAVIHKDYFERLKNNIINELNIYHKDNPLKAGISKEELRSKYLKDTKQKVGDLFINYMIEKGYIKQVKESISLKEFEIKYNDVQQKIREEIEKVYMDSELNPPNKEEILRIMKYDKKETEKVFAALLDEGIILKIKDDFFIHKEIYLKALNILEEYFKNNDKISVGNYRDLLNTNRKAALNLLENFDEMKITKRIDNERIYLK